MTATIREVQIDPEFRGVIPVHSWDELADLQESVERFGYLAPFIAWRNEAGVPLLLDGHARLEILRESLKLARKARANDPNALISRSAEAPAVVTIELASRDEAVLWIVNAQLGRRNLSAIDRIALVAKREEIVARQAKANQSASLPVKGQFGFQSVVSRFAKSTDSQCVGAITDTLVSAPIDTRVECAKAAGVSEKTYDAGKQVIAAVADGKLPQETVADINAGKLSIHGVAKNLKGKPTSKAKSGWKAIVAGFVSACRRFVKRDPGRSAEIAAELRRLADEVELEAKAAA